MEASSRPKPAKTIIDKSDRINLAVPASQMGAKIVAYARGLDTVPSLPSNAPAGEDADLQQIRTRIYDILSSRSGHDFSGYKTKTFVRRVLRRMQLLELTSFEAYSDLLTRDPAEVMSLFRDLLINVTTFFRDASAFNALNAQVIPKLFEGRDAADAVRVWVPGCSTGEEVYSIAILLLEHMDDLSSLPRVQIFATDIDDKAL
jgi:two-component system CheB/CheR fusion protein